MTFCKAI